MNFTADDRVKLSFHNDGFVQFSGVSPATIKSGRDPVTGEPKGLGLFISPLNQPIISGQTFGMTLWGICDFDVVDSRKVKGLEIFHESDFIYQYCTEESWKSLPVAKQGYAVEAFVFPTALLVGAYKERGSWNVTLYRPKFKHVNKFIKFRVVQLADQNIFLGIMVSRIEVRFPSYSGYSLSSPSDRKGQANLAHALFATYGVEGLQDAPLTINYKGPRS